MAEDPIVVVGGGLAAARLAAEYRASGGEADVTILSADLDPPYHRPPLTKGFLRGEQDRESTFVRPRAEYEEEVVDLRLEATVERIDPRHTRSSWPEASGSGMGSSSSRRVRGRGRSRFRAPIASASTRIARWPTQSLSPPPPRRPRRRS
ncbi:MAG: NAD(P)/FAD-dependent oxidoreductase [Gaiella sp.]|nr:NAD(P)/FAD-dependent oxidoreductase [Gaiella sp.]